MHLIDTTCSIPYGVQQLKESFGISCAFDQSVQRLSKCIKTVSKGMLKEHLLVVGNSMTCTGNLIGFSTGGFKALFRSLKIQVPFTEATLFTPMKRFDKAAEKCHTDSLGSVVSSCSWGKHVAVGTGSNFEVMWGQKHQVGSNEDVGTEVYDLLAWVQETPDKELTVAGLGSDVDDLLDGFQNDEMPLSLYEKPTFEDNTESECRDYSDSWQTRGSKAKHATDQSNKPSWEKVSQKSDNWKVHGSRDQPAVGINELPTSRPDVWSCWSNEKAQNENAGNPIWTANKPVVENSSGWHRNLETQKQKKPISRWKEQRRNNSSSMPRAPEADSSSGWGENTENKTWVSKFPDVRQNENAGNQADTNWMVKKPERSLSLEVLLDGIRMADRRGQPGRPNLKILLETMVIHGLPKHMRVEPQQGGTRTSESRDGNPKGGLHRILLFTEARRIILLDPQANQMIVEGGDELKLLQLRRK